MTMRYREFEPSPELRPFVVCYWILEGRGDGAARGEREEAAQPVFPDGHPELLLHYGDRFSEVVNGVHSEQPRAALAGQTESAMQLLHGSTVGVVAARLRPAGIALVSNVPASEFTGRVVELRSAAGISGDELMDAVGHAAGDGARIRLLERFLIDRAATRDRRCRSVEAAVALIRARGGTISINALARHTSLSTRQLHRQFLGRVGVSPKQYARVVRFQRSLTRLQRAGTITDVAHACGYYDHPHFTREFQSFAGMTPTQFLHDSLPLTQNFLDHASDLYKPEDSAH